MLLFVLVFTQIDFKNNIIMLSSKLKHSPLGLSLDQGTLEIKEE